MEKIRKPLSKVEQKLINGGGFITKCKNEGDFCDWISSSGYGTGTCVYSGTILICQPD